MLAASPAHGQAAHSQSAHSQARPILDQKALATRYFGADAPWFLANTPFLEIDDPEIQRIFYYRWQLLRSHIREIGPQGTTILEFLPPVPWAQEPYTDLNDSTSFHLAEARWLRNPAFVANLIDHEYPGGGNDRHFSESIAAASYAATLVTGDPAPALRNLPVMEHVFNLWDDHRDRTRNLYWVEPLADATEYTISSIDASGAGFSDKSHSPDNQNGFTGGQAFRPSINAYQFANAQAIASLATLAHQPAVAADYTARAEAIRKATLDQLWNPALQHFTDRYQRSTPTVTAGDFIRGRELVGFTPWLYELPPTTDATYAPAWQHVLNPKELAGPAGLRTVEPTYPRYLTQYRFDGQTKLRECQWNGPSWPFQTSQTLTAMANLLNDYPPAHVTPDDYVLLLRQYTHQHFLSPGHPDLQEDYDPDHGGPIVGLPRSHHYAHSTFNDLILTGLLGIRPSAGDTLTIHPLLPSPASPHPIRFFALENLQYHGHTFTLLYDRDGTHFHRGSGLQVLVDGKLAAGPAPLRPITLHLTPVAVHTAPPQLDLAVNVGLSGPPTLTASSADPAHPVAEAIDGRLWFFPEIPNGWSPLASDPTPSLTLDLGRPQTVATVELAFSNLAPSSLHLQFETPSGWQPLPTPATILPNGITRLHFPPIRTSRLRLTFDASTPIRLIELKAFNP